MRSRLGAHDDAVRRRIERLAADGGAERMWRGDAAFWGDDKARQAAVGKRLGWMGIAEHMRARTDDLSRFADELREAGFGSAVLLGMGGSSLAPEVLRQSVGPREGFPRLRVLDTTDPSTILATRREIDVAQTLFIVSSKSGGTIEVMSLFAYFLDLTRARLGDRAGANFIAITDEGTSLQRLASEHGFRRTFINPSDIGGRYSALSYFGLVPAAVTGADIGRLLDAAIEEEHAAREPGSAAVALGAAMGEMALAGRDKCTLVVSPQVQSLGLWLEQLIAESTGKDGTGVVPVADEPLGTPLKYGDDRLFVQLRLEGDSAGEQDSVVGALTNEGQPALRIDMEDVYALGAQFVRWEAATAIAGQALGINPFDEPNVQESKDNTNRVLEAPGGASGEELASARDIGALLRGLAPPAYFAIAAYVQQTPQADEALASIRALVRDATGVATTLGYGPRYLHSTGQIHKGGPPTGVFLQLVAEDREDAAIPDRPYTFGQLKRAQATGDLQSLRSHGRPVMRVHLGADADAGLAALRESVRASLDAAPARR